MTNQIMIANETVTLDEQGRVSLNTLHKLSGLGMAKQPSNWLRLEATQELIEALGRSSDLMNGVIVKVQGGLASEQGTYAHELLAISYAGWISPKFQLQVNQAFLDSKRQPNLAKTEISISQLEYIELLKIKIEKLEGRKSGKSTTPLSHEEKQQIKQLSQQGYHYRHIAKLINRSFSAVRAVVREK